MAGVSLAEQGILHIFPDAPQPKGLASKGKADEEEVKPQQAVVAANTGGEKADPSKLPSQAGSHSQVEVWERGRQDVWNRSPLSSGTPQPIIHQLQGRFNGYPAIPGSLSPEEGEDDKPNGTDAEDALFSSNVSELSVTGRALTGHQLASVQSPERDVTTVQEAISALAGSGIQELDVTGDCVRERRHTDCDQSEKAEAHHAQPGPDSQAPLNFRSSSPATTGEPVTETRDANTKPVSLLGSPGGLPEGQIPPGRIIPDLPTRAHSVSSALDGAEHAESVGSDGHEAKEGAPEKLDPLGSDSVEESIIWLGKALSSAPEAAQSDAVNPAKGSTRASTHAAEERRHLPGKAGIVDPSIDKYGKRLARIDAVERPDSGAALASPSVNKAAAGLQPSFEQTDNSSWQADVFRPQAREEAAASHGSPLGEQALSGQAKAVMHRDGAAQSMSETVLQDPLSVAPAAALQALGSATEIPARQLQHHALEHQEKPEAVPDEQENGFGSLSGGNTFAMLMNEDEAIDCEGPVAAETRVAPGRAEPLGADSALHVQKTVCR